MYLGTRTSKVRTEHNHPRGGVREFLSTRLEPILKELDIATTAVTALLVLDLVLDDEGLVRERDRLIKRSRDGMVGSLALSNKALIALQDRNQRVFDLPLADVAEGLTANGSLLGSFRRCPTLCPVFCELLNKRSLYSCRL